MKNNFKLTPQIYKEIIKISNELPKLVKLNKDGSHQMRTLTNTIKWSKIPLKDREQIKNFREHGNYVQRFKVPVFVPHYIELIKLFQ